MCLPDGIPKGRRSFVLREDSWNWLTAKSTACIFCRAKIALSAAMVFEETAGATPELAHLEPLVGSRS